MAAKRKTASLRGRTPSVEELKLSAEIELGAFLEWVYSSDSEDFYDGLNAEQRQEFNRAHRFAARLYTSLQVATMESFAARANANMPQLRSAVADIKRENERARRAAAIIGAVGRLLDVLVPILLP